MKKKESRITPEMKKSELATRTAVQLKKLLDKANMTLVPIVHIVGGQIKGEVQLVFKE